MAPFLPAIKQGIKNERNQLMIRVLLVYFKLQRILMHVHIIPHFLSILMLHIRRRRWLRRSQAGMSTNRGPPTSLVGVIRVILNRETSHHVVWVSGGIKGRRTVVIVGNWRRWWWGMRRIRVMGMRRVRVASWVGGGRRRRRRRRRKGRRVWRVIERWRRRWWRGMEVILVSPSVGCATPWDAHVWGEGKWKKMKSWKNGEMIFIFSCRLDLDLDVRKLVVQN